MAHTQPRDGADGARTGKIDDLAGVLYQPAQRALTIEEINEGIADALIQGAMELFGVPETVTFDRVAAQQLGWRLLS